MSQHHNYLGKTITIDGNKFIYLYLVAHYQILAVKNFSIQDDDTLYTIQIEDKTYTIFANNKFKNYIKFVNTDSGLTKSELKELQAIVRHEFKEFDLKKLKMFSIPESVSDLISADLPSDSSSSNSSTSLNRPTSSSRSPSPLPRVLKSSSDSIAIKSIFESPPKYKTGENATEFISKLKQWRTLTEEIGAPLAIYNVRKSLPQTLQEATKHEQEWEKFVGVIALNLLPSGPRQKTGAFNSLAKLEREGEALREFINKFENAKAKAEEQGLKISGEVAGVLLFQGLRLREETAAVVAASVGDNFTDREVVKKVLALALDLEKDKDPADVFYGGGKGYKGGKGWKGKKGAKGDAGKHGKDDKKNNKGGKGGKSGKGGKE